MPTAVNEGLWRLGAQYGEVVENAVVLAEVVEVTANIEVNRIEIPLVGSTKQGYKPGRESREGTFRFQKIDSRWERQMFQFLSYSLETRRARRDAGLPTLRPFNLNIRLDDPDALGTEEWALQGCLIWRLPLGFNITDDIIDRELQFTWETETPVETFIRTGPVDPQTGVPPVTQYDAVNRDPILNPA